jgi:capsular polysaccharide transport system permease protein
MFIGVIRVLKTAYKGLTPPNMPATTFLIVGIVPCYMFMTILGTLYKTLSEAPALLPIPRVTPVDIAISRALKDFCVYTALFFILLLPISIYDGVFPPQNGLKVLFTLITLLMLGISLGFVGGAALRVFPPSKQFLSYLSLVNRMLGGMLFVITMIPATLWPYFTWNPMLHCMESLRDGWFATYTSPVADLTYVYEWILGLLLLGLSLERFQRRVPYI